MFRMLFRAHHPLNLEFYFDSSLKKYFHLLSTKFQNFRPICITKMQFSKFILFYLLLTASGGFGNNMMYGLCWSRDCHHRFESIIFKTGSIIHEIK